MDALALAVSPLYDSLTMEKLGGGVKHELGEVSIHPQVYLFPTHEHLINDHTTFSFFNRCFEDAPGHNRFEFPLDRIGSVFAFLIF